MRGIDLTYTHSESISKHISNTVVVCESGNYETSYSKKNIIIADRSSCLHTLLLYGNFREEIRIQEGVLKRKI